MSFTRIGTAITHPKGEKNIRREYGVWATTEDSDRKYVQFVGNREAEESSLSTPSSLDVPSWRMPFRPLIELEFETITYFKEDDKSHT